MVDAVHRKLAEIQATERDGDNDHPELLSQLKRLQESNPPEESLGDNAEQSTSEAQPGRPIVDPLNTLSATRSIMGSKRLTFAAAPAKTPPAALLYALSMRVDESRSRFRMTVQA